MKSTEQSGEVTVSSAHLTRLKRIAEFGLMLSGEPAVVFEHVVRMIAELFQVRVVCLSEIADRKLLFRAVFTGGKFFSEAGSCPLEITPCATVERTKDLRIYQQVQELFPQATFLRDHNAFTYCGFPSLDSVGRVVAVTCLLDDKPHEFSEEEQQLLRIIGQRIAVEVEHGHIAIERKLAEEKLRNSERCYRAIVEDQTELIARWNFTEGVTFINEAGCRYLALPREEILGRSFEPYVFEDDKPALQAHLASLKPEAPVGIIEHRLAPLPNGEIRWNQWTNHAFFDAAGGLIEFQSDGRDITGQKQMERRGQKRREILEQLAKGVELPTLLDSVVCLVEQESMDTICAVMLLDESRRRLLVGAAPRLPDFFNRAIDGMEIGPGVGSCGTAAFTGQRVIVENIDTHPFCGGFRELAREAGVKSCRSEPIISSSGQVLGTFAIYHTTPQAPKPDDIQLIGVATNLASIAIERRQADQALLRSYERFQNLVESLVESVPDAIVITNMRGEITLVNRQTENLLGYKREELVGQSVEILMPESLRTAHVKLRAHYHRNPITRLMGQQADLLACHKNGCKIPVEILLSPIETDEGKFVIASMRDITERKLTEWALRAISVELVHLNGGEYFNAVAAKLAELLNVDIALVGATQAGAESSIRTLGTSFDGEPLPDFEYALDETPCEKVVGKQASIFRDAVTELFPQSKQLAELGIRAYAGVPLFDSHRRPEGLLCVMSRQPFKKPDFVLPILEIFNIPVAAAMERMRAESILRESERFNRATLNSLSAHIAILEADGTIIATNHAWDEFAEENSTELRGLCAGTNYLEVCERAARQGDTDAAAISHAIRSIVAGRQTKFHRECSCHSPTEKRWYLCLLSRFPGAGPSRVVVAHESITPIKQAQVDTEQARNLFESLARNSPIGVYQTDTQGRLTYLNDAGLAIGGLKRDEALNDGWQNAIHPDDLERVLTTRAQAISSGTPIQQEDYRVVHRNGSERWVVSKADRLRNSDGSITGYVGVLMDITERKNAERQSLREHRLEAIGSLASGLAHDLNNALTPIVMVIEHLRMRNPDATELIDVLEASGKRASEMVRRLVAFAEGREIEKTSLQVGHLLKEMMRTINSIYPKKIVLKTAWKNELPTVMGNSTQLHQVFLNLCINARDAMPDGGTLSLEAESKELDTASVQTFAGAKPGPYVVIRVRDTGIGIPPENVEHIFESFFTTKDPGKGTGFGLATVRSIVQQHGGFVSLYSKVGKGSTFSVHLPVVEDKREPSRIAAVSASFRGNGEKVMVVDDDASVRRVACLTLQRLNFNALTANGGAEAVALAVEHGVTLKLVITDMNMPKMDGLKVVRTLKAKLPSLKFIVMSGRLDETAKNEFRALGVNVMLDKPFTEATLAKALCYVCQRAEG